MEDHPQSLALEGDEYASMAMAELDEFVQGQVWTYAKTMPQWPHEYIVRKNVSDDRAFCRFVMTIRRFGNDAPFFTKTHRYLDQGTYTYWTMGDWLATTIIINRASIVHEAKPLLLNPKPFVALVNRSVPKYRADLS